jgi:hypothetical protein
LRKKIPALRQALRGRFTEHHALLISLCLEHTTHLETAIARLEERIDAVFAANGSFRWRSNCVSPRARYLPSCPEYGIASVRSPRIAVATSSVKSATRCSASRGSRPPCQCRVVPVGANGAARLGNRRECEAGGRVEAHSRLGLSRPSTASPNAPGCNCLRLVVTPPKVLSSKGAFQHRRPLQLPGSGFFQQTGRNNGC